MIATTLRRVITSALGAGRRPPPPRSERRGRQDVDRRIEAARRRLKATIPPPED